MTLSPDGSSLRSLLVALVVVVGATVPAAAQAQDDVAGLDQMLARINQMRSTLGVAVLTRAAELDAAAAVHSADMAANERLEHVSATTGDPPTRLAAAGVRGVQIAENIALHADVMSAHAALVASDAHRANWMNPAFTRIGLAAARSPRGVYVTQVFASAAVAAVDPWALDSAPANAAPAPSAETALAAPPVAAPVPAQAAPATVETSTAVASAAPAAAAASAPAAPVAPVAPTAPVADGTRRVAGYWVFSQQRWWYYPLPADARPGQVLQPASLPPGAAPPGYGANGYGVHGYGASGYGANSVVTSGAVVGGTAPSGYGASPWSASTTTQWAAPPAAYYAPATVPSTAVYVPAAPVYAPVAPRTYVPRRNGRAPWFGWSPRRTRAR